MTMIYYPVDLAVRCYLSWLLGHDLRRFPVEAGFMAFGMIWEIFFYRVILRMIEWEKAGELYYFDNHGQRVFDGNPVENSFEFVYISDSVEVKVQQAWPALEVCYEYGKVLPPNLEIEVKDFTVKPQGGNDE